MTGEFNLILIWPSCVTLAVDQNGSSRNNNDTWAEVSELNLTEKSFCWWFKYKEGFSKRFNLKNKEIAPCIYLNVWTTLTEVLSLYSLSLLSFQGDEQTFTRWKGHLLSGLFRVWISFPWLFKFILSVHFIFALFKKIANTVYIKISDSRAILQINTVTLQKPKNSKTSGLKPLIGVGKRINTDVFKR